MKKETLEEAAEKYAKKYYPPYTDGIITDEIRALREGFVKGYKVQAEKMYSEEEVIAIVEKSRATGLTAEYLLLTEKFKKK
jgi:hypothetical protein